MALISIIIPCYNVEKYIDRCMESVVNQTIGIDNLEVILVNDASTDGTLDKLYQWEKKFADNIMVVTYEENLRQGGARNVGLNYASSDYIGFVDSDDWIETTMYEKLYNRIKEENCDVVKGRFIRETYPGQYKVDECVGEIGSFCTGLYLKKIIVDNKVYFPEKVAYEDNYWSTVLKIYIQREIIIEDIVYHYFVNEQSTVTTRNALHHFDRLDIEIGIVEEYKRRGFFEKYKEELEAQFIQRFYLNTWYIIFLRFDYIPDILEDMKKVIFDYFPNYKENPKLRMCNEREKALLRMLDISRKLTADEMMKIKLAYLESF